jgi:hypothetical protein
MDFFLAVVLKLSWLGMCFRFLFFLVMVVMVLLPRERAEPMASPVNILSTVDWRPLSYETTTPDELDDPVAIRPFLELCLTTFFYVIGVFFMGSLF